MSGQAFVYIMANKRNGTIYIGSATDLARRVWQHRNDVVPGFTRRYGCHLLVWYEVHDRIEEARLRERRMKEWGAYPLRTRSRSPAKAGVRIAGDTACDTGPPPARGNGGPWHCGISAKEWRRAWKLFEIEGFNPDWVDLYDSVALPRTSS